MKRAALINRFMVAICRGQLCCIRALRGGLSTIP